MTVESLKETSDSIVIAKTVRSESFWNEDHSAILTKVTLQVEEALSGTSAGQTEVIIPGGQVGKFVHEVSDMPVFLDNEESIVFIEKHESGVNVVAGGALGKISIQRDPVTQVRTVSGADFFLQDISTNDVAETSDETDASASTQASRKKSMTLDEFKARIK